MKFIYLFFIAFFIFMMVMSGAGYVKDNQSVGNKDTGGFWKNYCRKNNVVDYYKDRPLTNMERWKLGGGYLEDGAWKGE